MGMGDCTRCIKYLLFVFNLIFCLIGLAILAIGVWLYVAPSHNFGFMPEDHNAMRYTGVFLMVIGSIITVLGFLGCCGAIFENRCLLVLFFILLLLVFLVLLASGIILLFMKSLAVTGIEESFTLLLKEPNNTVAKNQTDFIQKQYHCCGAKMAEKDYTSRNLTIPESCKPNAENKYVSCTEVLGDIISQASVKVAIAVFVTAVVALLGMIFSMMLCCAITDMA